MRIKELLEIGVKELKQNQIEEPRFIARQLLCFATGKDKVYLITNAEQEIQEKEQKVFLSAISKIINNIPLQYITNTQEFMKMKFYVDENVLIPRADTEIVALEAIKIINENNFKSALDMCTGSGAIAISIAKYTNNCNVTAVDISNKALEISNKNAISNNVKISLIHSNMFQNIEGKYDLIISNPPYIKTNIINTLDENVKKEPILALDGGEDGLEFYKIIEENACKHLNKNGYLVLEIGFDQKEEVTKLLEKRYKDIICKKDIGGNDRVIICKLK